MPWALLSIVVASLGCKRSRAPELDVVWDETPTLEQTDALGALSPPWAAPTRVVAGDGILSFWLHEPGTPALHLRLQIPTTTRITETKPTAALVVTETARTELARRLGTSAAVTVERAPGRLELVVHAADAEAEHVLNALGQTLAARANGARLDAQRRRLMRELRRPTTDEIGIAAVASRLLGLENGDELIDETRLAALSRTELASAWSTVLDPRATVLLVHAGRDEHELRTSIETLATTWRGRGRRETTANALARLRPAETPTGGSQRPLGDPPLPFDAITAGGASGRGVVVLGRVLPTSSVEDRGLARLIQRLLQEDIDARLTVSGPAALLAFRIPLSETDAATSVRSAMTRLTQIIAERQPAQRSFQAAQLWLGARVVRASLAGEDWTMLWSEAMDLADDEASIAVALAREANAMLQSNPETLLAFQKKWLDPTVGQPGWRWVVVGATTRQLEQLRQLAPVVRDQT